MLTILEKIKLSRESIQLVAQLKEGELSPLEKVKKSRRVNEITVLLGGVISSEEPEAEPNIIDEGDGLSSVTTSENYRWKDTAVIAGARKFLTQTFDEAKKEGRNIVIGDIDWDELNKDDRLAQALINKKNVFGVVDWNQLRDDGMPSEVAYLIKRVYDAVAKEPVVPTNAESRKNYVLAISNLRENLEKCRDFDQVVNELVGISKKISLPSGLLKYYQGLPSTFDSWETRVISELGDKFYSWLFKTGNSAIQEARTGRIPRTREISKGLDWVWLNKEPKLLDENGKTKKPKATSFQLNVADNITRVGGPDIKIRSSKELEQLFNLKGIQSGNWVLKDKSSAEFHMQAAAEAMVDMSDILGIEPKYLGLNGNLSLAFGARGTGGCVAHYERQKKLINITKIRGGGFIGHEYFHALDNLLNDLVNQSVGDINFFGTRDYAQIKDKELSEAFKNLNEALQIRKNRLIYMNPNISLDFNYSKEDLHDFLKTAKGFASRIGIDEEQPFEQPIEIIKERFKTWYANAMKNNSYIHSLAQRYLGEYLIARHFIKRDVKVTPTGAVELDIEGFDSNTDYYTRAVFLDKGKIGKNWSKDYELAARSFSAYLEDKLALQGRKNDYLTFETRSNNDNWKAELAYPQGVEREAVNAAFDQLFHVIKEKKILETASQNKAFMDALFTHAFHDPDFEMVIGSNENFQLLDDIGSSDTNNFTDDDQLGVNDILAQSAATSSLNQGQEPNEQQLQSGDYTTGKFKINELHVHIENPAGSVRSGISGDGETWETKMLAHYGFFADSLGHDGDEVDVFVVPGTQSDYAGPVFVIHQNDENGDFDEHKVIIGANSKAEATLLYQNHYDENWSGMGNIEQYSFDEFVQWLNRITEDNKQLKGIYDSWSQDGHYEHVIVSKVNTAKAPKLQESRISLEDPIVVLENGSKYFLVHGIERLTLAKERNERMVPAIIFKSSEVSWSMVNAAIKLSGHPVDPVALGALITKLSEDEAMQQL